MKNGTVIATLKRIGLEIIFPSVCTLGWAVHTGFSSLGAAITAFVFGLYAQGQILRVSKQVQDRESFKDLQSSIYDLRGAVDALGARHGPSTTDHTPARSPNATSFINQAESALNNGFVYPAMLVAAVGFEQAIQRAAEKLGVDRSSRGRPVTRLLDTMLSGIKDENIILGELKALWRVRNGLVHSHPEKVEHDEESARTVVNGFKWGIDYLDGFPSLTPYTEI